MSSQKCQRQTKQRQIILDELRKLTTHPHASALYELVRKRLPKISLGTVYRNLELLAETGDIQKIPVSSTQARYDGNTHPHYHVHCLRCDKIDDVEEFAKSIGVKDLKKLKGYDIINCHMQFEGLCPRCQKGEKNA